MPTIGEILRNWTKLDRLTISGGVRSISGEWISKGEPCWYNSTVDIYCKPKELGNSSQFIVSLIAQFQDLQVYTRNVMPIDSEDAAVDRLGSWTKAYERMAFGQSYIWSATAGNKLTYNFIGTGMWLRMKESPDGGIFKVRLDEGEWTDVDSYNEDPQYEVIPLYSNLELKTHKIEIEVTNTKNANSTGYVCGVDCFIYEREVGALQAWVLGESMISTRAKILGVDTIGTMPYRALLHYELAPWAFDAELNRLLSFVYGSENIKLKQKAVTGELQIDTSALASQTTLVSILTYLQTATAIGTIADVTAAASATRLIVASTPCKSVVVRSLNANTGKIRVGDTNVTVSRGAELSAGDTIVLSISDVNLVYVFGNASDKVSITYVN